MRIALAALAALALAAIDYLVIAASFLGRPRIGEVMIIAMVLAALAAVLFRQRWLIFAVQNVVTVLAIMRAVQSGPRLVATDIAVLIGTIALGNVLAWLVARAVR